ncbi:hypothetical protein [Actinomycetospora straminea]|uniref:Secreted protein n=1 Tax=Actinomycetospora straminea TaxID=663607 RepID=A0ABP9FH42_9PSEU|nr:hypothetical protein [Actinomycetospora straminea]MDD7936648.1 hypothetical protein [Actinomycetospora straminea]
MPSRHVSRRRVLTRRTGRHVPALLAGLLWRTVGAGWWVSRGWWTARTAVLTTIAGVGSRRRPRRRDDDRIRARRRVHAGRTPARPVPGARPGGRAGRRTRRRPRR